MCITQSLRVLCLVVCLHSANAVAFKMDFDADPPPTTETPETAMPELFAGTSDPNAAIEDAAPQKKTPIILPPHWIKWIFYWGVTRLPYHLSPA